MSRVGLVERLHQIQVLRAEGFGPTAIGERIARCKSVISRELKRNCSAHGYKASNAEDLYRQRLRAKGGERQPWR